MFKIISTKLSDFIVSSTKREYFTKSNPNTSIWTYARTRTYVVSGYMSDTHVYGIHK